MGRPRRQAPSRAHGQRRGAVRELESGPDAGGREPRVDGALCHEEVLRPTPYAELKGQGSPGRS